MTTRKFLVISSIALLVAACSIGKPVPQATTYVVEPNPPTQRVSGAHSSDVVRMGNIRVAAAFSGNALVYRTSDASFTSDPYQAFIADPPAMFGTQMAAWLDRAGPFKAVAQPDSALSANYMLEAAVTELYGDFRPGRSATAVVEIQFALVDLSATGSGLVFSRTISRRIPLEQSSPEGLVKAYGRAVSEILTELAGDLAARRSK
jgi:ABC-type uncharacterized transport system auxiliary subunit